MEDFVLWEGSHEIRHQRKGMRRVRWSKRCGRQSGGRKETAGEAACRGKRLLAGRWEPCLLGRDRQPLPRINSTRQGRVAHGPPAGPPDEARVPSFCREVPDRFLLTYSQSLCSLGHLIYLYFLMSTTSLPCLTQTTIFYLLPPLNKLFLIMCVQ